MSSANLLFILSVLVLAPCSSQVVYYIIVDDFNDDRRYFDLEPKIRYIQEMQKDIIPLIEGYKKFRDHYFDKEDSSFIDLVHRGQQPKVLMIACSDSRVDPAIVMNCQPGELFVIRNVANLVPPYENDLAYHGTSAALEFGICMLKIRHVILFGHTQCGGIQALLEHSHEQCGQKSFITKWMELAKPAHDITLDKHPELPLEEKIECCGKYSLIHSLKNLETFPWIREKIQQGALLLHAWNFNMTKGIIEEYNGSSDRWKEILPPLSS